MSKLVEIKEEKHGKLMVSKSGKTAWHTYGYKKEQLPEYIADLEREYKIKVNKHHVNFIEDVNKGVITHYFTKAGMYAIGNQARISTKVQITARKYDFPFAFEVTGTAILPDGTSHEHIAVGVSTMPLKDKLSINQLLAWTETKARMGAIAVAMEISTEQVEVMMESEAFADRMRTIDEIDAEILQPCPICKKRGYSRLQSRCVKCGITKEEIRLQKVEGV